MRLLFTFFLLLSALSLQAQIGITGNVLFHQVRSNENFHQAGADPYEFLMTGREVALNYRFQLPNKRVEFMPTLYYGFTKFDWDDDRGLHEGGFQLKTNVYLFDLFGYHITHASDYQGAWFKRGFFVQLTPGSAVYQSENVFVDQTQEHYGLTMGGGLGLDIRLSNLLTLTPQVAVRHGFSVYTKYNISDLRGSPLYDNNRLTTYQAGLQLSFRFDH